MSEYLVITINESWQVRAPVPVMWVVVAWLKARCFVTGQSSKTHIYRIR